jgi:hypothetical protein
MGKRAKKSKESKTDFIGFRSAPLSQRLRAIVDANPGKTNLSDLVRTAVEEKLDRLESEGVRLKVPAIALADHLRQTGQERADGDSQTAPRR